MNYCQRKLLSGFVRPILLVLLFAALGMALLLGLETLSPEYLRYALEGKLLYVLGGALILLLYLLKRSSKEATKAHESTPEALDPAADETARPDLEDIRRRIRYRKGKEG